MARYCIEDFEGPHIPKETILKYKNKIMVEPYEESKAIDYGEENYYGRDYGNDYGEDYGTGSDNDTAYNVDDSPATNTTEIIIISVCSVISFVILCLLIASAIFGWKRPNHWFGGIGLLLHKLFDKRPRTQTQETSENPNTNAESMRNTGGDRTRYRRRRHISSSINYNPNEFSNSNDLYGMPI